MSENNEIVLRKFRDKKTGEEFALETPFVEREVKLPTLVHVPLYVDGEIIPEKELAKLGLEIVGYTQDELDAAHYGALYQANPDLATRVRQYRDQLDGLGLGYQATTDEIDAAIQSCEDLDATGSLELASRIRTAFSDIVVNLELMGNTTASGDAWADMPKLIRYLPDDEAGEEPEA